MHSRLRLIASAPALLVLASCSSGSGAAPASMAQDACHDMALDQYNVRYELYDWNNDPSQMYDICAYVVACDETGIDFKFKNNSPSSAALVVGVNEFADVGGDPTDWNVSIRPGVSELHWKPFNVLEADTSHCDLLRKSPSNFIELRVR